MPPATSPGKHVSPRLLTARPVQVGPRRALAWPVRPTVSRQARIGLVSGIVHREIAFRHGDLNRRCQIRSLRCHYRRIADVGGRVSVMEDAGQSISLRLAWAQMTDLSRWGIRLEVLYQELIGYVLEDPPHSLWHALLAYESQL